uniref:Uncharacterized protein n=1 Tax=Magallana gigas TaxID=29159 RepID=K1RN23_MAGGI
MAMRNPEMSIETANPQGKGLFILSNRDDEVSKRSEPPPRVTQLKQLGSGGYSPEDVGDNDSRDADS